MVAKQNRKRLAPSSTVPSKKRKITSSSIQRLVPPRSKKHSTASKGKGKEKAADRGTIPLPSNDYIDDLDLSEQDFEVLETYGGTASFLDTLDPQRISMSKKETERLHRLNKPMKQAIRDDDLPSIESHDEDNESWSSDIDNSLESSDESDHSPACDFLDSDSDAEMSYERVPRKRPSWEGAANKSVKKLPIKLADGRVQQTGVKFTLSSATNTDKEEESEADDQDDARPIDDVSTGARFGRPAVVDVIGKKSGAARIYSAKEQIASICQEIIADPENSLGLLRRLHTFSLANISTPSQPDPIPNDLVVRKLALLSQLAVFKDIIPGYRIRTLSEKEKEEKVSQMVARTRDWEQGLVLAYQTYLRSLEDELKSRSALADLALKCMCTLLTEATHFNFRINLMTCIVARLSRKTWDTSSDLCLNTIISVFRDDLSGTASLDFVRLINRMVKEKRFNIHPEVLTCLLHLRLKSELGIRASESKADEAPRSKIHSRSKAASRRAKGKSTSQPYLSKKAKKALKEKIEIDKEFREAEAEVDKEERNVTQTETLKLIFVLYFSIIKNPKPTPLLPAALHGISKFAHLISIDFFNDLMKVLKKLISQESSDKDDAIDKLNHTLNHTRDVGHRLSCIVTAFDLLSGQGEALNIDLSDFISQMYAMILPLGLMTDIDTVPLPSYPSDTRSMKAHSLADMLFRALNFVFSSRSFGTAPSLRSAAFAKRLLSASLHWPPPTTLRTLDFVKGLIARDPKLEILLSTEDRTYDGIYRPDIEDPQLCCPFGTSFWELHILHKYHWNSQIKEEAGKLLNMIS